MAQNSEQHFTEVKSSKSRKRRAEQMDIDLNETQEKNDSNSVNPQKLPEFNPINKEKLSVSLFNILSKI